MSLRGISTVVATVAGMASAANVAGVISEAAFLREEAERLRKRLGGKRGRYVIVYMDEDGLIKGLRARRKSAARGLARELGGRVGRWRKRDWMPSEPQVDYLYDKQFIQDFADLF